jgi:DNA excision repair protein ERCC-4
MGESTPTGRMRLFGTHRKAERATHAMTGAPFPPLKVRAGEGLPCIVVDTREQAPLAFRRLPWREATLATGDYSIAGLESDFAVERKSVPDLIGSLTAGRDRFMREVDRLRGMSFARLLVIGSEGDVLAHRYRSNASPTAILHSLHSIEAKGLPVAWAASPATAAELVERYVWWYARAVAKRAGVLALERAEISSRYADPQTKQKPHHGALCGRGGHKGGRDRVRNLSEKQKHRGWADQSCFFERGQKNAVSAKEF